MARQSEAIRLFLNTHTHADLAVLYNKAMECQVNVAKDKGERVEEGDYKGKSWITWTDGIQKWKSFRIPRNANSEPIDNDHESLFNLDDHAEGVGLTGWNWMDRTSHWVGFDFDAMVGHSDAHAKKLSDKELLEIQDVVHKLPFITLRKSTSGRGLHLYIHIDSFPTANHTEHAALARSILSMVAGLTGFNFTDKVDVCGSNMWFWHRKMKGTDGLKLIKQGTPLPTSMIPSNWKDHLSVVTRRSNKTIHVVGDKEQDVFDELTNQRAKVRLDSEHTKLINWLNDQRLAGIWHADQHMLSTHTSYLLLAHKQLSLAGEFHTISSGKEFGTDINCFLYPLRNGAWVVRRFGVGTAEHKFWRKDAKGYMRCFFNRDLVLEEVARLYDAIELENKAYQFPTGRMACEAILKLGVDCKLPTWISERVFKIRENFSDGKYACLIPRIESDNPNEMEGWALEKSVFKRIYHNPRRGVEDENSVVADYDELIRHIVSEQGEDLGWTITDGNGGWRSEPITHLRLLLKSKGIGGKDVDLILGSAVNRAWNVVNRPFQGEYPGDRQWNRSKARFKILPTIEGETLSYPTWERIFRHCGGSLDESIKTNEWCRDNGVHSGADYLKLWFGCLIRHPQMPLPYLGFFGPQDSGKSTLHEMFCDILLEGGYIRADSALTNGSGFNGELYGAILAIIEETDVTKGKNQSTYNRLKDWVTSSQISIHEKGVTPFMAPNYSHWIQCANDPKFIPVFSGDTRVTLIFVPEINKCDLIPKRDLRTLLVKEAPDLLAYLLQIDIPDSRDRLMLPVIRTAEKMELESQNMNPVESFFAEKVTKCDGAYISAKDLYRAFIQGLEQTEALNWSANKFGRYIPLGIVKGRISSTKTQDTYYGNISLNDKEVPGRKYVLRNHFLVPELT